MIEVGYVYILTVDQSIHTNTHQPTTGPILLDEFVDYLKAKHGGGGGASV